MIWTTSAAAQPPFDWTLVWTIAAALFGFLALLGVVYAVIGYYRDHPKRQLEYKIRGRRLVQSTPNAKLEVKVNGIDVPDPYLCEFQMVSNSRADIPSTAFDTGQSITIRIEPGGAFVVGDMPNEGIKTSGEASDGWRWAQFNAGPQLIRKGARLSINFISSGVPTVKIVSPLIDVPVVDVTRKPSRSDVAVAWFALAFSLSIFVSAAISPYTNPDFKIPMWLHWGLTVVYAGMVFGSAALLRHHLHWRKLGR